MRPTLKPARARRQATGPPPAPEPTTMKSKSGVLGSFGIVCSSERLQVLDERALVGVRQRRAEVVALVFDEVGTRIHFVEVGDQLLQPFRGRISGEPFV